MRRFLIPLLAGFLLLSGCAGEGRPLAADPPAPAITTPGATAMPTATATATATPAPTALSSPTANPAPAPEQMPVEPWDGMYEKTIDYMDIDGDGTPDTLRLYNKEAYREVTMALTLSGGGAFERDTEGTYFEEIRLRDLTGDGRLEMIVMLDTGGCGGAGCHVIYVLGAENGQVRNMPLPVRGDEPKDWWLTGYDFNVIYRDGFLMDIDGELLRMRGVPVREDERKYLVESGNYSESGKVIRQDFSDADGIYDVDFVSSEEGTALRIRQYVYAGSHSGGVGDGVSLLRWDGEAFRLIEQSFEPY